MHVVSTLTHRTKFSKTIMEKSTFQRFSDFTKGTKFDYLGISPKIFNSKIDQMASSNDLCGISEKCVLCLNLVISKILDHLVN